MILPLKHWTQSLMPLSGACSYKLAVNCMLLILYYTQYTHLDSSLVAGNVVLSSSVADNGRRYACGGEIVLFTCQVIGSLYLEWNSPLVTSITYTVGDTPPAFMPRPPFFATLTSVTRAGLNTNFSSTLQVNASRTFQRTDTIIQCRNQQQDYVEASIMISGA